MKTPLNKLVEQTFEWQPVQEASVESEGEGKNGNLNFGPSLLRDVEIKQLLLVHLDADLIEMIDWYLSCA